MKRKLPQFGFLALALIGALLLAFCILLPIAASVQSPSLGIIGGADGPTVIMVAGHAPLGWVALAAVLLMAVGIIGFVRLRGKR